MDKQTTGEFISILRKSKGYTQHALGDKIGVSSKAVSKWECGDGMPDISVLPALAQTLGVTIEEILLGKRQNSESCLDGSAAKKRSDMQISSIFKQKEMQFSIISVIAMGFVFLGLVFEFFLFAVNTALILFLILSALFLLTGSILYVVNLIVLKGGTEIDGFDTNDVVYSVCKKKLNTKIFNFSYMFGAMALGVILIPIFVMILG